MPIPQVQIREVKGNKDLDRFVKFPWKIYRDDPNWVPPLIGDTKKTLTPGKHPFHDHADVVLFLATEAGELVGRCAAIVNHRHNEFHEEKTGFFGFFESVDSPEVAGALLEAAGRWVAERGMDRLRGPANFSTNEECAMLIDGFDSPPVVMMPYNRPYYPRLLEKAGFIKAKDLVAYHLTQEGFSDRVRRLADAIAKREKAEVRTIDMKRYQEEIERFTRVYNQAWEKNWGFVPMTDKEIHHMAKALKPAINPDMVLFVEKEGETIGFALGLPDMNHALIHANGRLFPFGLLKILYHARKIRMARILVLGILEPYRGRGLDVLLYTTLVNNGLRHKYHEGEFSWVLEDNTAMRKPIEKMGGKVYKKYRFYEKELG